MLGTEKPRIEQLILSILITVGFFIALFAPLLPKGTLDAGMIQTLQNMFILIVGFFFGSSSGSAKKDDTIQAQAAQIAKE